MAQIRKVMVAGALVVETIYPAPRPHDSYAARQGRSRLSSQAQRLLNRRNATQKLELSLAANLPPGSWKIVLTYRPEAVPATREQAMKAVKGFLRKLRERRQREGIPYRCWHRAEHKHKSGTKWHHHIYITAGSETPEELEALWGCGLVYIDKIVIDADHTYEQLARYMIKERPDKLGQMLWSCSRGLQKPDLDRIRMPDDAQLEPPDGVIMLEDSGTVRTVYGSFRTIKYMMPSVGSCSGIPNN